MAIFKVTAPDGTTYKVEAPDGTPEWKIKAYIKNRFNPEIVDPTEGMSGFEKFRAGLGKSFYDTGAGAKQLGYEAANLVGLADDQSVSDLRAAEAERRARDAPLMNTGAGMAGNMTGLLGQGAALPVGGMAAGASRLGATTLARALSPTVEAALYGGLLGAVQPLAGDESRLGNAALGAAAGGISTGLMQGAGNLVARRNRAIDQALSGANTNEYKAAVGLLENAGVPLSTGQKTGTNWLKATESTLADIPFGGKPLQTLNETQRRAYQRHLLKLAGLDDGSDMITKATLDKLDDVLSKKYAAAFEGQYVDLADSSLGFIDDLARVEAEHSSYLPFEQKARVREIINNLLDEAAKQENGKALMSGEQYQRIRSRLGKLAKSTKNSDGYLSVLYGDLKRSLDAAFERAAGPDKFKVDKQYAAAQQLKGIYGRLGGPEMSEGFIPPSQVSKEAAKGVRYPEWQNFARAGGAVLPDRLGNSGTAQRNVMIGLLGGSGIALDPASLIYGPAMTRAFSSAMARGVYPNTSAMIPRLSISPAASDRVLALGRGAALGLLAQPQ